MRQQESVVLYNGCAVVAVIIGKLAGFAKDA